MAVWSKVERRLVGAYDKVDKSSDIEFLHEQLLHLTVNATSFDNYKLVRRDSKM